MATCILRVEGLSTDPRVGASQFFYLYFNSFVSTRLHAIYAIFMVKFGFFIGILQIVLLLFQCF